MLLKKLILFLAILPVVWLAFEISGDRDLQKGVRDSPDANKDVVCTDGTRSKSDCILVVLAKEQLSPFTYFLINLDENDQWMALYTLAGLGGAIISFWLLFWQGAKPATLSWDKIIWRLSLGAASGVLSYLVVKLPAGIWGGGKHLAGVTRTSKYAMYDSLELMPAAAGMFIGVFFEGLKGILKRILNSQGKGG